MNATLIKEFTFEAAHRLVNHNGKCARPHGHSYRVIAEIEGPIKPADGTPDEGMVLDFEHVKAIRDMLDHQDLNEVIGEETGPTTAENIALWIAAEIVAERGELTAVVTVWETATSSATVSM